MTLVEAERTVQNFLKVIPTNTNNRRAKQFDKDPIWAHEHKNKHYVPPTRDETWERLGGSINMFNANTTKLWRTVHGATKDRENWRFIVEPDFPTIHEFKEDKL